MIIYDEKRNRLVIPREGCTAMELFDYLEENNQHRLIPIHGESEEERNRRLQREYLNYN